MLPDYKQNLVYTPLRFRHLHLVVIQAAIGASGAPTLDSTTSSPNTTIARNSAGQYTITFPKGQVAFPLDASTILAEQDGSSGYWETLSATGGTGTLEFGVTPGTPAEVANGARICIGLLLGKI